MNLQHCSAYGMNCEFELADGRTITLKALRQQMTYRGLMMGYGYRAYNEELIERFLHRAEEEVAGPRHRPVLIEPQCRNYFVAPGDMEGGMVRDREPEWLPLVACIGEFESFPAVKDDDKMASTLVVVWFQDEYSPAIGPDVAEKLRALDWNAHAVDFDY